MIALVLGSLFGLFRVWSFYGTVPDLILLLTVSLALAFKNWDFLFVAIIGGVWTDILYGLPIGSFSLIYGLVGVLCAITFEKWLYTVGGIKWQYFLVTITVAGVISLAWLWAYTNILYAWHWSPVAISGLEVLKSGSLTLLANLVFAYPIYIGVEFLAKWLLRRNRNQLKL